MSSIKDIKDFIQFAAKQLGLKTLPRINFAGKEENKKNAFGHFLGTRNGATITVRITNRHPIDVMRTIAHELIHFKQKMTGVRKSEQMKEDEANALAGRIMREYDITHPRVFNDKPITEDSPLGGIAPSAPNMSFSASNSNMDKYDPLINFKSGGILKRNRPKGLRAIIGDEQKKIKRSETRNDQ
jgi:hypothetical protein